MIHLECPYCFARLEIGEGRGGSSMTCPFCKGQVAVPKPHKPRRYDEYEMEEGDASHSSSMVSLTGLTSDDIASLEAEEDQSPKKKRARPKMEWHLLFGGFAFPWTPGAVLRWLLIALWAMLAGWLANAALGNSRPIGELGIVRGFTGLLAAVGAIITGICCVAVAAIHGLTIVLETTEGNDRMENWPNVGLFVDWIGQVWFIVNTATVSVLLAMGTAWLLDGLRAPREIILAIVIFISFPIFLLCALESDSPFLPVSKAVFVSLRRKADAWGAFYVQSGLLLAASAALFCCLQPVLDVRLAIPLAAMLFAAVDMIYFRLLGRLAYYCSFEPLAAEEEEQET
jgi:hypothetical protein